MNERSSAASIRCRPAPSRFDRAFAIDAATLEEAAKKFGPLAKVAIERTMREIQEMRRQAASSLVIPQGGMPPGGMGGMGGLGGGGKIQMP